MTLAAGTKSRISHHRSPAGEMCGNGIFLPSFRRTSQMELFQRQHLGNFLRRGRAHMGFSERIDTILN